MRKDFFNSVYDLYWEKKQKITACQGTKSISFMK